MKDIQALQSLKNNQGCNDVGYDDDEEHEDLIDEEEEENAEQQEESEQHATANITQGILIPVTINQDSYYKITVTYGTTPTNLPQNNFSLWTSGSIPLFLPSSFEI